MQKLLIQDLSLKDKRVLMRVDFNVPLKKNGSIADDLKIRAALPSIEYILNQGASLILMSHLGRPKGKKNPKYSLAPCAKALSQMLQKPIAMAPDCIGSEVEKMVYSLQPGQILLLENLRFHNGEEHPEEDPSFVDNLAKLGDIYVNDAFGTAHRKHGSTYEIVKRFPGKATTGFLMDKEIAFLGSVVQNPKRPFFVILGGSKVSTKIGIITHLIEKIDGLFLGGAIAYTFLKAQGMEVGNSLVETDFLKEAKTLLKTCEEKAVKVWLPSDLVIANRVEEDADYKTIPVKEGIPSGWEGVDIGPKTLENWTAGLTNGATIFWNGPVGVFEIEPFSKGTKELAKILSKVKGTTIVGGGDSLAAIRGFGLEEQFTHLSTGGGAALELIEYGHLPGIDILTNR